MQVCACGPQQLQLLLFWSFQRARLRTKSCRSYQIKQSLNGITMQLHLTTWAIYASAIPMSVSIHWPSVSFDGYRNWRQTTSFGATVCSINFSRGSKFVERLLTSVWFAGASDCGAAICRTHHWRSPALVSCRRHTLSCRQSGNAQLDTTDILLHNTNQHLHFSISQTTSPGDTWTCNGIVVGRHLWLRWPRQMLWP